MASIKIILRKKKNKDGRMPLALLIIKDRRKSHIHLGHSLYESDWDAEKQRVKKSHPNSARLNNFLAKTLAEGIDKALELETNKKEVSSHAIKLKLKPKAGHTFFPQAELYLNDLKQAGKYNRYTADKPRVKRFKEFLKSEDIAFSDITVSLLERFRLYLISVAHVSERTAVNHLVVIRSVFSQAIKAEVTELKYYPFGAGKISIKFPESLKIGLSSTDIAALENLKLIERTIEDHCRNLWLFSFYFAGMRISDVLRLKWSDLQDGRLFYAMGKNRKGDSLKIHEKALAIIEQYKSDQRSPNDFIFPELKVLGDNNNRFVMERRIMNMTSRIDKVLNCSVAQKAGISKKLTMHIARHTFGNLSGDKIPIQMLQKLYRHSSVTTTISYQACFIHKDADDALEAVINT